MENNKIGKREYVLLAVFAFAVAVFFFLPDGGGKLSENVDKGVYTEKENPYLTLDLKAKAVSVFDVNSGRELFSVNSEDQLPLASLTKVMTALVAVRTIPEYSTLVIEDDFLKTEGDSGLFVDEKWKLKDLLDLTLVESSNDGARAIASVAGAFNLGTEKKDVGRKNFLDLMNEATKEIGLDQTYFLNETGLDLNENISGAYGSAKDMALLFEYVLKNEREIFDATTESEVDFESLSDFEHISQNTNSIVNEIPLLMASKTGFTDLAGGNLVVAFDAGLSKPVIISVLGSTVDGRFEDVKKLAWATLEYIDQ